MMLKEREHLPVLVNTFKTYCLKYFKIVNFHIISKHYMYFLTVYQLWEVVMLTLEKPYFFLITYFLTTILNHKRVKWIETINE